MSASTCPICDYANVYSSEECVNCGVPLLNYPVSRQHIVSQDNTSARTARANRSRRENQHSHEEDTTVPAVIPGQRQLQRSQPGPPYEANERAVIQYARPALAKIPLDADPYETNMDLAEYHPQQGLFQPLVTEEKIALDLEPWKTDRLPWTLPRRRPQLSGKIIHIRNELEFPDFPNILRAIVDIMSEILWMAANQPAHKEGERVQVTIIRLRTQDGQLRDARLMGYMRGANLSLGDTVSFWGWRRRGSLMVRKGYNHTSKATIITNVMSMLLPGLIILAVIIAVFVFAFYKSNILSFLSSFHIPGRF